MTIVVSCTLPPFKMLGDEHNWSAWLQNAEAVQASVDEPVVYMAALEVDARGLDPFKPLLERLDEIGGKRWTFSIDDGVDVVGTNTRLRRICMGHNLCGTFALEEAGASHVLFLASDTQAPDDVLPRLLELDVAAAACHIRTYCLGVELAPPWVDALSDARYYRPCPDFTAKGWDVRMHMESCACMLLRRDVINRIKWRSSGDDGTTDDPSMHKDLREFMGEEVYSRHDVIATHWPEAIGSIEDRHAADERTVVRAV